MRYITAILLTVILMGCYCKRCQGQSADLVINATEAQEFKQTALDLMNADPNGFLDILFLTASGAKIPTGTATVHVNQAQSNRWFNTDDMGSFFVRSTWKLGLDSVATRRNLRSPVYDSVVLLAPTKISNEAKRLRFLAQLQALHVPEAYE